MEPFLDDHDDHMHRLLTEVIHKIKNSLGGMGGFAALLERDLGPDDPRTHLAQRIQNGVVRMNDFVVDLMLYLQNPEPSFSAVDPVPMIRQAWAEFSDENELPSGALELPDAPVSCSLDLEMFRKTVVHAFHFACLSGGSIERVRFAAAPDASHALEVTFPDTQNLLVEPGPKVQRLKVCEPIEAKLSLYLVVKLAKFNRAKTSLKHGDAGRNVLVVHLNG